MLGIKHQKKIMSNEELEDIVYFENGKNPTYEEWEKAYIELYDIEPDYEEYQMLRGDLDYTR